MWQGRVVDKSVSMNAHTFKPHLKQEHSTGNNLLYFLHKCSAHFFCQLSTNGHINIHVYVNQQLHHIIVDQQQKITTHVHVS